MVWDLFITHAWRYHDDWVRLSELLDADKRLAWRNFSVPWHDPAMDPNTEVGGRFIRNWLETQIIPVAGVIALGSVFERGSGKRWVVTEVEFARQQRKPILGLPSYGQNALPDEMLPLVDAVTGWHADEIIKTFEQLRK